jgi:hypothetical protein
MAPIVLDEMSCRDAELAEFVGGQAPGFRYVPLALEDPRAARGTHRAPTENTCVKHARSSRERKSRSVNSDASPRPIVSSLAATVLKCHIPHWLAEIHF